MFAPLLLLAATLSVEDYATMPQLSSPRWSPDGTRIAYVVTKADLARSVYDSDVWIIDADGSGDRRLTFANGTDNRPRWSPDGTQLAFLSDRGGRNAIWLLDPRGGEARPLTSEPAPVREFEWSPDGKHIAFTRQDGPSKEAEERAKERDDARVVGEGTRHVHLYAIEVASQKANRLTIGDFSVFGFSWAPDGQTLAHDRGPAPGLDGLHRTDVWLTTLDGKARPLVVRPGHDRDPKFSPDGKWIAFTSAGGVAHWLTEFELHVVAADGGGTPRKLAPEYGRSPEAFEWTSDSRALVVEGPWNTTTQLYRFALDGTYTDLTKFDGVVSDGTMHDGRIAAVVQSLTMPPELHVDRRRVTNHNAAYRNRILGETRVIRWNNPKDGLEIEGLLTLPVGYEGGRVPLLTFVHGGPASRFDQGFLGYLGHVYAPHALAAEGFAVLRPNPRGTGGYGAAFRAANRNDWAGMDWLDIEAGIDHAIAGGIADPERLGLMGWSYGGYIATWALGHSERFKAISIGAPVVDLLSFHGTTDIRDFLPSYFPELPLALLHARSPLWHLKKTNTRVLVQHGQSDDRVPLSQGEMLYRRLQDLGIPSTMVVYPRTPHVPREPKLRMDVARRNVELFVEALRR